jgi:hypothetical protein
LPTQQLKAWRLSELATGLLKFKRRVNASSNDVNTELIGQTRGRLRVESGAGPFRQDILDGIWQVGF